MRTAEIRAALAAEKCWDRTSETLLAAHGEALEDAILQNREEVVALAAFMAAHRVRSYLEIGIWTGRLVSFLHRLLAFDMVAVCDHRWAEECGLEIRVPEGARCFWGDSGSEAYRRWRAELGHVDLVLIDANHRQDAVRRDFETNRAFPHRFLVLHDICGARPSTVGVRRFWDGLEEGRKLELVRPHSELGLDRSLMGLGVWSASEELTPVAG